MTTPRVLAPELALLGLLALLWGLPYLFIRIAVAELPPLTQIAARVMLASLFLLVVIAWRRESLPPATFRRLPRFRRWDSPALLPW